MRAMRVAKARGVTAKRARAAFDAVFILKLLTIVSQHSMPPPLLNGSLSSISSLERIDDAGVVGVACGASTDACCGVSSFAAPPVSRAPRGGCALSSRAAFLKYAVW